MLMLLILLVKSNIWEFAVSGTSTEELDAWALDYFMVTWEAKKLVEEIKQVG